MYCALHSECVDSIHSVQVVWFFTSAKWGRKSHDWGSQTNRKILQCSKVTETSKRLWRNGVKAISADNEGLRLCWAFEGFEILVVQHGPAKLRLPHSITKSYLLWARWFSRLPFQLAFCSCHQDTVAPWKCYFRTIAMSFYFVLNLFELQEDLRDSASGRAGTVCMEQKRSIMPVKTNKILKLKY